MQKKAVNYLLMAIMLCVGIYIGVFIGRLTSDNIQHVNYDSTLPTYYIDLNNTTAAELENLPEITPQIAINIIEYRKQYGNYLEVEELLDVPGIDDILYEKIRGYFVVGGRK